MADADAAVTTGGGPFSVPVAPVPAPRRRRWVRAVVMAAIVLGALAGAGVVTFGLVFDTYLIPSASMEPAVQEGDRIIVRGISGDEVHRGDIVIVRVEAPGGGRSMEVIKRVVAVGGEEIGTTPDGRVTIDGEPLDEPYLAPRTVTTDLPTQVVPEGHLFVMGDNRPNSHDSRADGPLPVDAVLALAVSTWPPPGDGF